MLFHSFISAFKSLLQSSPQQIVILMHGRPDGDAIGSGVALYHLCRAYGHRVDLISPTRYPLLFNSIIGEVPITVYNPTSSAVTTELIEQANLICCVDFAELKRVFNLSESLRTATGKKVVIDHHRQQDPFADLIWQEPHASSTAAMLYRIYQTLNPNLLKENKIALALYLGLYTDTGGFQYNTSAATHAMAGDLIEKGGVDPSSVYMSLYGNQSLNRMRLIGYLLSHRLTYLPAWESAYIALSRKDCIRFHLRPGDTEGLVYYALHLESVQCGILLTEQSCGTRLSFRAKPPLVINQFAATYFEGGGHPQAAGGYYSGSLEETISYLGTTLAEGMSPLLAENKDKN